ncbi:MAG TPA: GGDEF domain-containing protein [Deltaproteobacteria bacterium]|nr:GGDEF domain-containing protein [Deltaproteobacteria bacterium]
MFHIIPGEDRQQALRIKRFLMAFGTYAVWMAVALYCYYDGLFTRLMWPIYLVFAGVLTTNLVLYALLRSGLNRRFKDPSLTMTQMAMATVWTMIVAYSLNEGRQIVLLLYMTVFIFGTFKLNLRQFWILSVFALVGYGWVVDLLLINDPSSVNLKVEIFSLGTLFTVLVWFSFVGSYINGLRKKLSKANSELGKINAALGEANERIRQQAIRDDLTGAFNRGHLFSILLREKSLADRGETRFCLCMLDLDDFKRVNDSFGHLAGDTVLKVLCGKIMGNIRKEDYLARYGGEEFVLVLSYPELRDGLACVERLGRLVSETAFPGLPEGFRITMSMGLTGYQPIEDIDTLLKRADDALYRAKNTGKNRIVCDPAVLRLTSVGQEIRLN